MTTETEGRLTATARNASVGAGWCDGLRAGDPAVFAMVYREHVQLVYGFCLRRCLDASVAEDAVSMVFLEAWRLRQRAHLVDGQLRPWLLAIAHNVLRNLARARRRHDAALRRYHAEFERHAMAASGDAAEGLAAAEQAAIARAAIRRLSRKLREVAELCLIGELPPREAASILQLPESTVRSRLALVRQRLRLVLQTSEPLDASPRSGHRMGERRPGASVRESKESTA